MDRLNKNGFFNMHRQAPTDCLRLQSIGVEYDGDNSVYLWTVFNEAINQEHVEQRTAGFL